MQIPVHWLLLCVPVALFMQGWAQAQDAGPAATDAIVGERPDTMPVDGAAGDGAAASETPSVEEPIGTLSPSMDVVITAPRPVSKDRTQDTTLIQGERIRDSSRGSTFEAIAQESADVYVPGRGVGLHGVSNGATGGIRIRGLGGSPNSQILVVEDGVPDYQGIFGHPIPDAYVPHLIDEVLVIKGGDSSLYGTNAMGGVIVIRSRWRDQEGYEVQNDVGYGSYSTVRESSSVLGRVGAWDVAAAFTDMKTDGHREGAGGNDMVGATALRYRLAPNLRITLRNKVVHVQGGDPGPAPHPTIDHWFDVWRDSASLEAAYAPDRVRLSLTPYLNVGVHRLYDGFYSHDYVGGAIGEMDLRVYRKAKLLLGLAADRVVGSVENRITSESQDARALTDVSLYSQLTLRPVAPLSIVLGARGLVSSKYGFVPLYKAGVRWEAGRGVFVHGNISRNFRQPTIRELYLPYPTANPDLLPEYAVNSDLGAGYESEHLTIACTAYHTEARDLIKYFGVWPAAEVVNIDHLSIWGVEGRVAVRRMGPISTSIGGDWQDAGRYTRQNPNAKVDFSLEAAGEFGANFVGGNLTGEWVHGLYMADYERQPIPDVFVMDLAVRYRHTSRQRGIAIEPYLLLRNFLNRQYAHVAGYPMPGFNVLLGLKVGL